MLSTNTAAELSVTRPPSSVTSIFATFFAIPAVRARWCVSMAICGWMSRARNCAGTVDLLLELAAETGLEGRIAALFAGERINRSEDRPVLHMAQRDGARTAGAEFARLVDFAERQRDGHIDDVVNIGIGGSDLGPAMVGAALAGHADGPRGALRVECRSEPSSRCAGGL